MQSNFETCVGEYRKGNRDPLADEYFSMAGSRMLASLKRLSKSLPNLIPADYKDIMQEAWMKFDDKIMRPYDYDGLDFDLVGYFTRAFVKAIPNERLAALLAHPPTAGSVDEQERHEKTRSIIFHYLNEVAHRSDNFPQLVAGAIEGNNEHVSAVTTCLHDWLNPQPPEPVALPEPVVRDTLLQVAVSLRQTTDARDRFLRWMATTAEYIARNTSRARVRRNARTVPLGSRHPEPTYLPVRGVSSILKAYLSGETAQVVKLKMEDYSKRDIAQILGQTVYWVGQKLDKAKESLANVLGNG